MRWEARRDGPDQDHGGGSVTVIETLSVSDETGERADFEEWYKW
jgi:hypothetical protein